MIPEIDNESVAGGVATALSWVWGGYAWACGETNITHICRSVWVGNLAAANNLELLKELGITHVVAVTQFGEGARFFPGEFEYRVVKIQDVEASDLTPEFTPTAEFIEQAVMGGGRVLVHCNAGKSRSVTLTAAWIMHSTGMTAFEAIETVRKARPEALPNAAFLRQLHAYVT